MRDSRGFTLIELLLVLLIVGILATIAMANYRHARLRAAETSAIGSLTAINQAQLAFMQTCGNQKFAPSLPSLGKPNPGTTAPYLSPDLTGADEVDKSGYRITIDGTEVSEPVLTCTGETPLSAYHVTADPVIPGVTGGRFFGTNVDHVIYEHTETFGGGKMPDTRAAAARRRDARHASNRVIRMTSMQRNLILGLAVAGLGASLMSSYVHYQLLTDTLVHERLRREHHDQLHASLLEPLWQPRGRAGGARRRALLCDGARHRRPGGQARLQVARERARLHLRAVHARPGVRPLSWLGLVLRAQDILHPLRDHLRCGDRDLSSFPVERRPSL